MTTKKTNPFNSMKIPTIASILTPLIVLGVATVVILDGFVSVPAGHVAVIFDRGRGVLERELGEGIHLKIPFWQSAILMNTRLQTYTMSANLSEADMINNTKALQLQSLVNSSESTVRNYALQSNDSNNSIDALTKDGQTVTVDLTVQFQIDGDNASVIYRTIGLNYVDKVVRPAARSITREKVTGFTSKELYNENTRQQMEEEIESTMKANFGSKNVILGDVLIRHIGFSQSYLNAIEEKQIAQQKIEKAEFEKQEAEIRKQKTIIEAEAEAESIRLKGEALASNPEVIQLQFVEKMSPSIKWGIMPDSGLPLLDISQLTQ
ncbi:prohibitin family protein [bacterium]|nr:prohibitin family protein [bacterium]NCQ55163.1 prohibitin family protein [Candidatus Parcubacteria bacterium]NCS67324.1 prohibitin family protein [Candidatus Peregrinibacteria bacterium]NCS96579.1 prohibitin family protein [bacterium]